MISRGELVEIGGGFRVPDVMAQSGAILREVGTTNRTRAADYAAAIGDRTALILRVHPSNFRIEGFTERPSLDELVGLGRRFGLPVVEDLGSGYLGGRDSRAAPEALRVATSRLVADSLAAGADVVMFSGDKLLGGPQAGIIVGRRGAHRTIRAHPLMRALRVDKLTYAALEATLEEYAAGREQRPFRSPRCWRCRSMPSAAGRERLQRHSGQGVSRRQRWMASRPSEEAAHLARRCPRVSSQSNRRRGRRTISNSFSGSRRFRSLPASSTNASSSICAPSIHSTII